MYFFAWLKLKRAEKVGRELLLLVTFTGRFVCFCMALTHLCIASSVEYKNFFACLKLVKVFCII